MAPCARERSSWPRRPFRSCEPRSGGGGTTDWNEADEDQKDRDLWEDNWDDDNVEDDFSVQLRAELEKQGLTPAAAAAATGK